MITFLKNISDSIPACLSEVKSTITEYLEDDFDLFLHQESQDCDATARETQKRTLQEGTRKIIQISKKLPDIPKGKERTMKEKGYVTEVSDSDSPSFIFTNHLGPCIGAVAKYQTASGKLLTGVTHISPGHVTSISSTELSVKEIVEKTAYKCSKFQELIEMFKAHSSYTEGTIEVYFAGGENGFASLLHMNLLVAFAKTFKNVKVIDTYFNPFNMTPCVQARIEESGFRCYSLLGMTNKGEVIFCKSHTFTLDSFENYIQARISYWDHPPLI